LGTSHANIALSADGEASWSRVHSHRPRAV